MGSVPKQPKQPQTYDEHLGRVIAGLAEERGRRQEDVAAGVGMTLTTYGRRERGETPFLASEVEKIANYLGAEPGYLLQRALDNFGGIDKLLSGVPDSNDTPGDDAAVLDLAERRSRSESKGVTEQKKAALRRKKDQDHEQ